MHAFPRLSGVLVGAPRVHPCSHAHRLTGSVSTLLLCVWKGNRRKGRGHRRAEKRLWLRTLLGYNICWKGSRFFKRFYLFIYLFMYVCIYFLKRGREGEREGKKHQCVVASGMPPIGDLARHPGMCPRLGISPVTLWFAGQCSVHWATPARAEMWETQHPFIFRRLEEKPIALNITGADFSGIGLCPIKQASCQCGRPLSSGIFFFP